MPLSLIVMAFWLISTVKLGANVIDMSVRIVRSLDRSNESSLVRARPVPRFLNTMGLGLTAWPNYESE